MIRPWYRSRLFWAAIPGLLFLLWSWWDSGRHLSEFTAKSTRSNLELHSEISTGGLRVVWKPGSIPLLPGQWYLSGGRWTMAKDGGRLASGTARPRQFDLVPAFVLNQHYTGMGKNPAARGWVPSPGRSLPVGKLAHADWRISWWFIVLAYLVAVILLMACWQYAKARRLQRRGGPRAVIWLRFWLPLVGLLCLTGCVVDSLHTRTRGWMRNEKYHVSWSHDRGLLIVSFFRFPLSPGPGAFDAEIIRESRQEARWTSRRWPLWLSPYPGNENSWELRLPLTFTLGGYVIIWMGAACWRWRRGRAHVRGLPSQPTQTG